MQIELKVVDQERHVVPRQPDLGVDVGLLEPLGAHLQQETLVELDLDTSDRDQIAEDFVVS